MFIAILVISNKIENSKYNYWSWIYPLLMWIVILIFDYYMLYMIVLLIYPIVWYKMILNINEKQKVRNIFI